MQLRTKRQTTRAILRSKHGDNPLVDLVSSRLAEAIRQDRHERSLEELARAVRRKHGVGCTRQDLHHLKQRGARCRADLRAALAAVLDVPEDYLGGRNVLPNTPAEFWEKPTAEALRYSRLMQQIAAAVRRDLRAWFGRPGGDDAYRKWGHALLDVFDKLSDPSTWRSVAAIPVTSPVGGDSRVMVLADNAAPVKWVAQMLEPWLAGKAYLNAVGIEVLMKGLRANPYGLVDPETPKGFRALRKYAAACRRVARRRLKELVAIRKLGRLTPPLEDRPE